ncbi:MAG TPA: hypothetical protein VMS08_02015 [Candidatus Saccharimonadia bacterium]|nr:hypothetical protein [Candidatus Saccharimonadia bacterium]
MTDHDPTKLPPPEGQPTVATGQWTVALIFVLFLGALMFATYKVDTSTGQLSLTLYPVSLLLKPLDWLLIILLGVLSVGLAIFNVLRRRPWVATLNCVSPLMGALFLVWLSAAR